MGVVISRSRGQLVIKKIGGSVLVLLCLELSLFPTIMASKRVAVVIYYSISLVERHCNKTTPSESKYFLLSKDKIY